RRGVEKSSLVVGGHLEAQPQRALDDHPGVSEVFVIEDLAAWAFLEVAVQPHDLPNVIGLPVLAFAELAALVAEATAHRNPTVAGVQELDLALASRLLSVCEDPDVGANPGVVEHLLRQGDDGLEPVPFDDPLPDVALTRTGASGEERRS